MRAMRNTYRFLVEDLMRRFQFGNICIDGRWYAMAQLVEAL
jgi:hypothetical protein